MATKFIGRSATLRTAETWPLYQQPNGDWRSTVLAPVALGIGNVAVGDIIDVRMDHEFSTAIPGAGAYIVNGQQSEHWYCWVMASTSVYLGTRAQLGGWGVPFGGGGSVIVPPQETNWDNLIHHLGVSRSGLWEVTSPITDACVWTRVYFVSGASYTPPSGGSVTVHSAPYVLLTARVDTPT